MASGYHGEFGDAVIGEVEALEVRKHEDLCGDQGEFIEREVDVPDVVQVGLEEAEVERMERIMADVEVLEAL